MKRTESEKLCFCPFSFLKGEYTMSMAVMSLILMAILGIILLSNKLPVATVSMAGALVCGMLGFIKYPEVFSGLAGTAAVLLMSMMVIGGSLFHTGLAEKMSNAFLKVTGTTERGMIIAIMSLAALLSAICNNVGVVTTLYPIVMDMCKRTRTSPSRLLMPLGYGAAVGGIITLVGTSTSVITSTALETTHGIAFGFLDVGYIGIPMSILSVIYMATLGRKILPNYEYNFDEIAEVDRTQISSKKMLLSAVILICILAVMIVKPKGIPLYVIAASGAIILILAGCITEKQAIQSISWPTIAICGGMMAVSTSIMKTGGGKIIADSIVQILGNNANPYIVVFVFFTVVVIMTQFLSNISTAALMAPLAMFIADGLHLNPFAFAMMVAVGVNAALITPVGTQSLTVIWEPGHYKFTDFVKVGMPILLINYFCVMVLLPLLWPF